MLRKGPSTTISIRKQALLEAVVERFADDGIATLAPVLEDTHLPALRKLEGIFAGIGRWKAERKELVLAIIEVWNSDGNAIVREKVRRMTVSRLVPLLSPVIRQGIDEGTFAAESPEETAMVLVSLMLGFQEQGQRPLHCPPGWHRQLRGGAAILRCKHEGFRADPGCS